MMASCVHILLPSFSLAFFLSISMLNTSVYTLFGSTHTHTHTHTHTQNTLASLVSDVPAVVDNEIPTGWETPGTLTDGPL